MHARSIHICAIGVILATFVVAAFALRGSDERMHTVKPPTASESATNLLAGVLHANGANDGQTGSALRAFRKLVERLRARRTVAGDARSRAQAIHEFAHAEILRGPYVASGSELAVTLAGGPFNCATSSAVFLALAREFDLDAHGVAVPGHVWCRVTSGDAPFDVETTCPDWFALQNRGPERLHGPALGVWQQHLARAARARRLDEPAFLAVFHFNRGVRLFRERQFAASAEANLAALALDPNCTAACENLAASVRWSSGPLPAGPLVFLAK